jgi:hypothetical protein
MAQHRVLANPTKADKDPPNRSSRGEVAWMDPELKWLIKLVGSAIGVFALIDEGRRRGWI